MRVRLWSGMSMIVAGALLLVGCGGDPIEFCEGCGSTPTPTPTASSTAATPTATPSPSPTPTGTSLGA